jgi:hypothetical protein
MSIRAEPIPETTLVAIDRLFGGSATDQAQRERRYMLWLLDLEAQAIQRIGKVSVSIRAAEIARMIRERGLSSVTSAHVEHWLRTARGDDGDDEDEWDDDEVTT